jgi:hypothetical protein
MTVTAAEPEVVDAVAIAESGDPEVDVFAEPSAEGGYAFEETDWPSPPAKEKPVNPFLGKVDELVMRGELPSKAVAFTDKADDNTKSKLRRLLAGAAGDRATVRLESEPIEGHDGWARYRFRLEEKRHRKPKGEPIDTTATPEAPAAPAEAVAPEGGVAAD